MIVVCPECSDPFDIPAEHIAELVQIACPRCSFRMILDFGAANNPALIEAGMRMASGFRSTADYRAASAGARPAAPARPHLEPVPAPRPTPRPAVAQTAARSPAPTSAPAAMPKSARAAAGAARVGARPGTPSESAPPDFDDEPTVIRSVDEEEVATQQAWPTPQQQTEVAPAPEGTQRAAYAPAPPPDDEEEVPTHLEAPRVPPHTPPRPATGLAVESADNSPAAMDSSSSLEPYGYKKGSTFGTVVLVILVVLTVLLVGASVALEGTLDPRPLLEKLYHQLLQ
jgi:DNA-directed RNA polymerase subunit RPC12/RpoP